MRAAPEIGDCFHSIYLSQQICSKVSPSAPFVQKAESSNRGWGFHLIYLQEISESLQKRSGCTDWRRPTHMSFLVSLVSRYESRPNDTIETERRRQPKNKSPFQKQQPKLLVYFSLLTKSQHQNEENSLSVFSKHPILYCHVEVKVIIL